MSRELLIPELIMVVLSILAATRLEKSKLLGTEPLVVFAGAYATSSALTHAHSLVLPWSILTFMALWYFSGWKKWESDVPYAWLMGK